MYSRQSSTGTRDEYFLNEYLIFWNFIDVYKRQIQTLQSWIRDSQNIVFFGGAGVSTESNIPDFRSQDGLYHQSYQYPPETILSHRFFMQQTEEFFRFYREKMLYLQAQPNQAHLQLAKWEREGKIKGVITQNIDGLHPVSYTHLDVYKRQVLGKYPKKVVDKAHLQAYTCKKQKRN